MRNIGIVYRKEMLDSLRDRRTLISMVALPVLVMPLLMLTMGIVTAKVLGKAKEEIPKVMMLGGTDSPRVTERLRSLERIEWVPAAPDFTNQVSERTVRAAVLIPDGFDAAVDAGDPTTIEIYMHDGDVKSSFAAEAIQSFLREERNRMVEERLTARNLRETFIRPFSTERLNVAPAAKVTANLLGGVLPYGVILLCLLGAMYPAMDLTAGEKERGTMETILCSPLSRTHLVLGKFFTVLTAALATALLSIASMTATFYVAKALLESAIGDGEVALALSINPASMLVVFVMILPVATFFAAAQLAVALFAKSFKEAQTYLSPLMFIVIVPAMISMAPGIELNTGLSLIPILNTSLVSKEIMSGTYHWGYISLIFLSSALYAAGALFVAVKLFERESVVFRV